MDTRRAIKTVEEQTTSLHRFGDGWKFNYYDSSVNAWRESIVAPYHITRIRRRNHLIETALKLVFEEDDPRAHDAVITDDGTGLWQDVVEEFAKQ